MVGVGCVVMAIFFILIGVIVINIGNVLVLLIMMRLILREFKFFVYRGVVFNSGLNIIKF